MGRVTRAQSQSSGRKTLPVSKLAKKVNIIRLTKKSSKSKAKTDTKEKSREEASEERDKEDEQGEEVITMVEKKSKSTIDKKIESITHRSFTDTSEEKLDIKGKSTVVQTF